MDRRKVDFPHPDGPMSAVTICGLSPRVMSYSACLSPYQNENRRDSMVPDGVVPGGGVGIGAGGDWSRTSCLAGIGAGEAGDSGGRDVLIQSGR